jgi:hypothetical protein
MNDVLLSPLRLSELENLIEKSVRRALNQFNTNTATDEVGGKALAREITGLSDARIYALVSKRLIPHKKRGNRLYFSRAELLAWVAEGNRETVGGLDA